MRGRTIGSGIGIGIGIGRVDNRGHSGGRGGWCDGCVLTFRVERVELDAFCLLKDQKNEHTSDFIKEAFTIKMWGREKQKPDDWYFSALEW